MLSFTLQKNAQVPLTANVIDQLGSPASAVSAAVWAVADEAIATLDHANGDSVMLTAHEEGTTAVTLAIGSLTTILHLTVAVTVPSSVSIDIGTPVAKAEAIAEQAESVEPVPLPEIAIESEAPVDAPIAPSVMETAIQAVAQAAAVAEEAAPVAEPAPEAATAAA